MCSTYHTKCIKQEKEDFDEVTDASMEGDEVKRESFIEDSMMTEHPRQDSSGIPNLYEIVIKHEPVETDMKIVICNEQENEINVDVDDLRAYSFVSTKFSQHVINEEQKYVKEEQQEDLSGYYNGLFSTRNQDQINVQSDRADLSLHVSRENYVSFYWHKLMLFLKYPLW